MYNVQASNVCENNIEHVHVHSTFSSSDCLHVTVMWRMGQGHTHVHVHVH